MLLIGIPNDHTVAYSSPPLTILFFVFYLLVVFWMQTMYFNQWHNYNTDQNMYPNVTAIFTPMAPAALRNAIADVLFLPHSAVSINNFNPIGYSGGGSTGGYSSPSTTATVTVLYQGTGLIPSVNAISDAFYEIIYAVTSQEHSPLVDALIKYGFPNTNTLNQINGQTMASKSYTAGQPTPAPTTTPAPTISLAPTKTPIANYGTTKLNATSVGDNVTTISHLNYQDNENFYWYIAPPKSVAKGTKLLYIIHFPLFNTEQGYDYVNVGATGSGFQPYAGPSCADIQVMSTTGVTLHFTSDSSVHLTGFIAQLTWQIYANFKPRKLMITYQSQPSLALLMLHII